MIRCVLPLLLVLTLACAPRTPSGVGSTKPPSPEARRLVLANRLPPTPVVMRHLVRLRIPDRDLDMNIRGMMRLDPVAREARVVGMGGFGLKLFDLTVFPESITTHFLHPSLCRIRHVDEHIAFCIRRIWLGYDPTGKDTVEENAGAVSLQGIHNGVHLIHNFSGDILTATTARGPHESWRILFGTREPPTGMPQTITFQNAAADYSLSIRLVDTYPGG
ncbi:hypothetical protein [Desulfoplanes sp.]